MRATRSTTRPRRSLRLQSQPPEIMPPSRSQLSRTRAIPKRRQRTPTPDEDEKRVCRTPPPHPEPERMWYLNHMGQMSPSFYAVDIGAPSGHDASEFPVCAAKKTSGLKKYLPRCRHLRHHYEKRADGTLERVKKIYYVVWGCNTIYTSLERAWRHWEAHDYDKAYITAAASRMEALDVIDSEHDDISACGSVPDYRAS
ncbi:hypothetical protein DFH06DRAFT_1343062 [Mycena polygramma]|nr:hypothetical protein DFH06DRAFT_1343062 [Mycena polygramma]